jgi:hypothetical protein
MSPTSSAHVGGESDGRVVPMKGSNKDGQPSAESPEGKRPTKETTNSDLAPDAEPVQRVARFARCAEVARKDKGARFTALALHHVTVTRGGVESGPWIQTSASPLCAAPWSHRE